MVSREGFESSGIPYLFHTYIILQYKNIYNFNWLPFINSKAESELYFFENEKLLIYWIYRCKYFEIENSRLIDEFSCMHSSNFERYSRWDEIIKRNSWTCKVTWRISLQELNML